MLFGGPPRGELPRRNGPDHGLASSASRLRTAGVFKRGNAGTPRCCSARPTSRWRVNRSKRADHGLASSGHSRLRELGAKGKNAGTPMLFGRPLFVGELPRSQRARPRPGQQRPRAWLSLGTRERGARWVARPLSLASYPVGNGQTTGHGQQTIGA